MPVFNRHFSFQRRILPSKGRNLATTINVRGDSVNYEKFSKGQRLLYLHNLLLQGETLVPEIIVNLFSIDKRTYQRDINELKAFFADTHTGVELEHVKGQGHRIKHCEVMCLSKQEVMVLAKILLESRAFPREEMNSMLEKLMRMCDPRHKKVVKEAVLNEMFHYRPVVHGKVLFDMIWEMNQAIQQRRLVDLTYYKAGEQQPVRRRVEPLAIMFSEFYFYLIANRNDKEYPYPAIFRLDRVEEFTVTQDRFRLPYADRFEEGEFRKRVQFMQSGELTTLRIIYRGDYLEAVLDRLPTAKIIRQQPGEAELEAKVFGRGVGMWLLSQGPSMEVVAPQDFRHQMRDTISGMLQRY